MVLGVYPTDNGYRSVRVKPCINAYDLSWAKGTVPTPYGPVTVSWEKKDAELLLEVTLPDGADMTCEVMLPDGQCLIQNQKTGSYACVLSERLCLKGICSRTRGASYFRIYYSEEYMYVSCGHR